MPFTIILQPSSSSVVVGGTLSFHAKTSGAALATATMLKDGSAYTPAAGELVTSASGTAPYMATVTFTKTNFIAADAGVYKLVLNSVESSGATISISKSRLSQIADEIKVLIEGMTIANGYSNNWGPCNKIDAALATVWPRANIRYKTTLQGTDLSHFYGMLNAEFTIEVEPKIIPSGTVNSLLDSDAYMDTALTDLVKLVLQNNGYLVLSKEAVMMFRSAVREDLRSGDVHRPGKLVVVWNVHYHNATIVPTPADLPVSNFTSVPTGLQVAFTNTSSGETSRDWDFGDGSSHSTLENPVHDYSIAGSYYVTLVSTNATGSDAITKIVTVTT